MDMACYLRGISIKITMKKLLTIFFAFLLCHHFAMGQSKGVLLPFVIEHGDTVPVYQKADVEVVQHLNDEILERQKYWARLIHDVRIVMPYAKVASAKMEEINRNMEQVSARERKKYLKDEESKLKKEFEAKLKDLNVRQGKLLIKLIDRETGHSSYALIKEYKSGFSAFVWNGIASIFGMSLKDKYDPVDKDAQVEYVVRALGYN